MKKIGLHHQHTPMVILYAFRCVLCFVCGETVNDGLNKRDFDKVNATVKRALPRPEPRDE
jgi:hypothetical protein